MFKVGDRVIISSHLPFYEKLNGKRGTIVFINHLKRLIFNVKMDTTDVIGSFFLEELKIEKDRVRVFNDTDPYGEEDWNHV